MSARTDTPPSNVVAAQLAPLALLLVVVIALPASPPRDAIAVTTRVVVPERVTKALTVALAAISALRLVTVIVALVAKVAVKDTPAITQVAVEVVGGVKVPVASTSE